MHLNLYMNDGVKSICLEMFSGKLRNDFSEAEGPKQRNQIPDAKELSPRFFVILRQILRMFDREEPVLYRTRAERT